MCFTSSCGIYPFPSPHVVHDLSCDTSHVRELAGATSVTVDMSKLWGAATWCKPPLVLPSLLWSMPSPGVFQTNLSSLCLEDGLVLGKLRLGGVWFMVTWAAWPQPRHCDWELCMELGRCFLCHLTPLDTSTPRIGFGHLVQSTGLLLVLLALDYLCIC